MQQCVYEQTSSSVSSVMAEAEETATKNSKVHISKLNIVFNEFNRTTEDIKLYWEGKFHNFASG